MGTKRASSVEEMSTLVVQEDPDTGELYIELPDRILKQLGWKPGDTVEWREENNGIMWTIAKKNSEDE